MKILMSGFTPRGVGSTKLLYRYMSNTSVITKTLRKLGHELDHRIVDVNEPLKDNYDIALIGIAVPQSLSSRYVYGALWAAEEFGPERTRFYVDDWLMHQLQSQLEAGIRNPEKRFYSLDNRHCFEAAKQKTDTWLKWFKFLSKSRYKLLIPAFPWARPRLLLPKLDNVQPVLFDPTPLAMTDPEVLCGSSQPVNLDLAPPEERERAWVLAAMRDIKVWYANQRFTWPVHKYGNKRQNEPVITERALLDVYAKKWGIIGAPYPLVGGGGGWRARYVHAAVTRSILFLDPDEGRTAGKPYDLFRSVVESGTTEYLAGLAEAQREHLFTNTWTLQQLDEALDNYVRGV